MNLFLGAFRNQGVRNNEISEKQLKLKYTVVAPYGIRVIQHYLIMKKTQK